MSSPTTDLQLPEGAASNHTPTPWELLPANVDAAGDHLVVGDKGHRYGLIATFIDRSDAEYTVAAVNAYEANTGRLSELEAEVARLRSALQFYANEANWIDTPSWDGDPECITPKAIPVNRSDDGGSPCDCGDRARAALEAKS